MDAGACPVSTPDCCCERVLQVFDLVRPLRATPPYPARKGQVVAVDIVHPWVTRIDVHKKVIWVAVRLPGSEPGERRVVVKSFRTFWRRLRQMAGWLAELGVSGAAMESTGCIGGRYITR
jgi:hypothetical protein